MARKLIGTAVTDENGEATITYTGTGAGQVNIVAESGTFSSETYTIHDYWYYNSTTYSTSSATLNVTLPSHFQLEYDVTPTTRNASAPYLDIGSGTNNRALVGQYARAGTNGVITYTGSQANHPHSNVTTLDTVNSIKFVYTGGDYTYSLNDVPMTVANVNISFSKIIHIESGAGGSLTNIRVTKL